MSAIAVSRSSSRVLGQSLARHLAIHFPSAPNYSSSLGGSPLHQLLPGARAAGGRSHDLLVQPPSAGSTHSHIPAGFSVWRQVSRQSSGGGAFIDHQAQLPQPLEEAVGESPNLEASEYWGIAPKEFRREDGSLWPWRSFKPSDAYTADMGIDITRHYPPERTFVDKIAHQTVKFLRAPVDLFFKNRHVSHALLLETVAAVPGMVGGMLLHLRSLRRFEHSGGWIRTLLEEAENERMHLMTWVEVLRPAWWERALVLAVQGGFFNAYFVLYLASPRLAHRFVGYLEEEAVRSYTDFLEAIDQGEMANAPAPLIAIDYWRLPKNATVRDVVLVVRADEAHHRDVNHFAADVYAENHELRQSPAPIGYH